MTTCTRAVLTLATAWLSAVAQLHAQDLVDLRRIDATGGDAVAGQAKAATCNACHGANGVSPVPMFPNLAGQSAEYLYWALIEAQREARADSPMTALVSGIPDSDLRDLAAHFSTLPRPAAVAASDPGDADPQRGGLLYREGDRARGVPPCQGCHGVNAEGHPRAAEATAWRAYPALRAQHATFLAKKLADYRDGKHTLTSNDRVMQGIARTLDDAAVRDIAAWLQVLP